MNIMQDQEDQPEISKAEDRGRRDSILWATPPCPFEDHTTEAGDWANGILKGRKATAWNIRNLIQIGSTCRYVSEAIDSHLAMAVAKSIFVIGAESPVAFRLGFILNSHDWPVPILSIDEWRRIGRCINWGLQGKELAEAGLPAEPTWLERMAFLEARDFMLSIIGHSVPENPKERQFEADTGKLMAWMGGSSPHYSELIPAPPGA